MSHTLGPKYPRFMYTRTYKQYTHVYWVPEIHERINLKEYISSIYLFRKKKILFLLCPEKKYFGSWTVRKINLCFSIGRKSWGKNPAAPPPPRKSNGRSLNRFSRDVAHMVSCYFLVYFHCNKQYKKANKTDRYPFCNCHLYWHYKHSSHVSCRVILTCAKIRFVLKLDLR